MLAELLHDALPMRMRRQLAGEDSRLPMLVDRTLPCSVDVISVGCLKVRTHGMSEMSCRVSEWVREKACHGAVRCDAVQGLP